MSKKKPWDKGWDLEWDLQEEDLSNTLLRHEGSPLLFGVVEAKQVLVDLENDDVLPRLRRRGYSKFRADNSSHVQHGDRFVLFGTHESDQQEYPLFDIRTRFAEVTWSDERIRVLYWDWLALQDPKGEFSPDRPPLPGQEYPGLGVFRQATKVMRRHVKQTHAQAIVSVPEYFHNAWLYSRVFSFYEPRIEGTFRALVRDLIHLGLASVSHAVTEGKVVNQNGELFMWKPHEQVFPLTQTTAAHFSTDQYKRTADSFEKSSRFRLA